MRPRPGRCSRRSDMSQTTTRLFPAIDRKQRKAIRDILRLGFSYLTTTSLAILFTLPFLWMVSSSLKTAPDLIKIPPSWVPNPVRWQNYPDAWRYEPFGLFFKNTAIYVAFAIVGQVLSCSLAAYGFARLRFRGRNLYFLILLSTMMLPAQVTMIPKYILFVKLGWINTLKPLIVPLWFGNAFYIFLLRQFFLTIPLELDEAALIDGASRFNIFWKVILPLSRPVLFTIIAFSFISHWNDFMGPLIYLNDHRKMTVAVGLNLFRSEFGTQFELLMAASVIVLAPIIVVFFMCQRYFVRGVVMSGIKA